MLRLPTIVLLALLGYFENGAAYKVDYTGHQVITVTPEKEAHIELLHKLRSEDNVDLWNEPTILNSSVMMRLTPGSVEPILHKLNLEKIPYFVAFHDLQNVINNEQRMMFAFTNHTRKATSFDFGNYNKMEEIEELLKSLTSKYSDISRLEKVGQSYENRPIYAVRISSGGFGTKPAIMMECGIHAREWTSVAAGAYIVNELITKYGSEPKVTSLVDKYEFYIVVETNPDGYIYSYTVDRLWRKTRSRSALDWLGNCRGVDANRNFDIEHCGAGTSRSPCTEIFCGDKPFSESEARTLRDMMQNIGSRMKAYFSIHAFSQYWMTPYGINKSLPPNYDELVRVSQQGVTALAKRYGTIFRVGSIANIIYPAAGSSVDYAYERQGIRMAFALELRDQGRKGFFLPPEQILPACEETYDGIIGAILAL